MAVIIFWAVAAALTLAVAGLLVAALSRGAAQDTGSAAYDLQLFRDQLQEVDRDLARGLIADDEAERLRTDISRRILAADAQLTADAAARRRGPGLALSAIGVVVVLAGVTFAIYGLRGMPGAGDLPMSLRLSEAKTLRATRPSQAEAEASFQPTRALSDPDPTHLALVEKLREVTRNRPDDLTGQELLARNEAGLGNYPAAAHALARILELKGEAATPEEMAFTAEMMIMAASGVVTPEAEAVLTRVLQREPRNDVARFQSGRLMLQTGRPDLAFRFWAPLWVESPEGAYWLPLLRDQLPQLAWLAGQHRYELPARPSAPALRGPDSAAMEAAETMSPEDRAQMISGMVEGLMARLAAEGGTAAEWSQLLRALGVMGDLDRGRAIHAEALQRFAGRSEDLALIATAARDAGITAAEAPATGAVEPPAPEGAQDTEAGTAAGAKP